MQKLSTEVLEFQKLPKTNGFHIVWMLEKVVGCVAEVCAE